jgi:CxxC motif-containing protein
LNQSKIQIVSGQTVVKEFAKEHMAPGELEKIVLAKEQIKDCDKIIVRIESEQKQAAYEPPIATVLPNGDKQFVCTICPKGCHLVAHTKNNGDTDCNSVVITGNSCVRGEVYGKQEAVSPMRVVTSTARVNGFEHIYSVPVKTTAPIPKQKVQDTMQLINTIVVNKPTKRGESVLKNIFGLGVDVVTTKSVGV